jgi:hypothetical protein
MYLALLKLIGLNTRAKLRRSVRGVKTVRGAVFLALGLGVFLMWLASSLVNAFLVPRADPIKIRTFFPMWMLAICVLNLATSAGERAIAFTPAEVDFLFPGPFTRRQLLAYKLTKSSLGAILTATLFSMIFLRYTQAFAPAWIGIFLSLIFLQLFSMSVVLIGEMIGEHAYTRGRKLIVAIAIGIALVALVPVIRANRDASLQDVAIKFRQTQAGTVLLAPFDVFGRILTAKHVVPEALPWIGGAIGINLILMLIVMQLDAHYMETAAGAGQRQYDRVQRIRRGGGFSMRTRVSAGSTRLRIPKLPRFAGAGPIAWRQLTSAIRQSKAVITLLLVVCLAVGPMLYFAGIADRRDPTAPIIGFVFWLNFMFANALRFDFRGDLDQMDVLKSLPVSPAAIVTAELIAPTLVLTLCQAVLLVVGEAVLHLRAPVVIAAIVLVIPFNALVIAIENLLFLLFPVRIVAVSPGDLQGVGRQMTIFLAKMVILVVGCAIAAGVGALAWLGTNHSMPEFVSFTSADLSLEDIALVPVMVTAFRKFDPASDTPP